MTRSDTQSVLSRGTAAMARVPVWGAMLAIISYQALVRPLLVGCCKHCPSCSDYAFIAVHRHGIVRGGWLSLRRLLRCHPFARGGIDPVPES